MIEREYFRCLWAQIMDSLQYIVDEFHIDGFCFKNAACLITGPHGQDLSRPVLVESISFDPVLANVKVIADLCSPFNGISKVYSSSLLDFLLLSCENQRLVKHQAAVRSQGSHKSC
jgi:hypothetical protein